MRARLGMAVALVLLVVPAGTARAAPGTLDFRQAFDTSRGTYIEGSISVVRVRDASGELVADRAVLHERRLRLRRRLPAGRYRVSNFQRPCNAYCEPLDPPAERCSHRVRVLSGGLTRVRATVRPGRGCTMTSKALRAQFPALERIRAARKWLAARGGVNSWALIDSHGRLRGWNPGRVYVSASVVKAMLLVARLRQIGDRMPDAATRAALGPMIARSSNDAADVVYARLGDAPLLRLARLVGMRRFTIAGYWANAQISAADQARFFRVIDRLVPKASRAYARRLLSSIVPWQRWGFSRFSLRHGFEAFFKGGWRETASGRLVHEAALFERGPLRVSMAVLTDGNPSHEHGTDTLRGVAKRVFGADARGSASGQPALRADSASPEEAPRQLGGTRAHRRAGLVDVRRFAPGIRVDLAYRTKDNLVGRRMPGYCEHWALMHRQAAFNLGQVQRHLRKRGLGLLVEDAYRPVRATLALVRWAERTGRGHLVGSYIARRSRHNTGSAVDLTLVRVRDGRRLRMGGYDDLGPRAHTYNARGRILRNRLILKRAMERFGFEYYWREWWHFEHRVKPDTYHDLTLGCGRNN